MKNKKLVVGLAVALAVIAAVFAGIFIATSPETETGSKTVNVTVLFADESQKEYEIKTDAEYLADALNEEGLLKAEEYEANDGMYTYIAGERADYTLDGSWWCVTKDGEMTSVGMNEQPIADGDSFEITNTPA